MGGYPASRHALQVDLLGPIEVHSGSELLPIAGRQERRLLAFLALHAGEWVSVDALTDLLWGERLPRSAAKTLQAIVSRLRAAVPGDAGAIVWRDGGYALQIVPDAVDAFRFGELVNSGRRLLRAGDPHSAARDLHLALGLWRAQEPADLGDTAAAAAARASLIETRLTALEDRIAAELALGRHTDLLGEMEELVETHPFRERFVEQFMLALYRSGRQPQALDVFRRTHRRLRQELGCDPSPALDRLGSRIAAQDPSLDALPPAAPGNLPAEVSSLVGRTAERAQLAGLLDEVRLVTLTGPGGVGKTSLTLRVAHESRTAYPGGTWWVDLSTALSPGDVPAAVATAVRADDASVAAVVAALGARRALVLLDNCEHVLGGVRPLVEQVLRDCPRVTMFATSREPLGVAGEHLVDVKPLDTLTAVQLFAERARAVDRTFAVTEFSAATVERICRQLDGLPLGIELGAARVRGLPLEEIARQLDRGLQLLVARRSGRHRSLDETIGWSYELLCPPQRAVLRRLSAFAGSFTLDTAARVALPELQPDDTVRLVAELTERSLLSAAGHGRFRMLDTVRVFASARLAEAGEQDAAALALATALTELVEALAARMRTAAEGEAVRRIEAELDNLRAAHAWACVNGQADVALRLPYALRWFAYWTTCVEVYSWAERAERVFASSDHPRLAEVAGLAAMGASYRDVEDAEQRAGHARQLGHRGGRDDAVLAMFALARISLHRGELDRCMSLATELIDLAERCGDPTAAGMWRVGRLVALAYAGRRDEAIAELAVLRTRLGNEPSPSLRAWTLYGYGEVLSEQSPDEALRMLRQAVELAQEVGNTMVLGVASVTIGSIGGRFGDLTEALAVCDQVIVLWHERGGWVHLWTMIRNLVELLARAGAAEQAVVLHAAAISSSAPPVYGEQAARLTDLMKSLGAVLGPSAFDGASWQGAAMADEQAVAFARAAIAQAAAIAGRQPVTRRPDASAT